MYSKKLRSIWIYISNIPSWFSFMVFISFAFMAISIWSSIMDPKKWTN